MANLTDAIGVGFGRKLYLILEENDNTPVSKRFSSLEEKRTYYRLAARRWRARNRQRHRYTQAKWRRDNPAKVRAKFKKWASKNREALRNKDKERKRKNPEKYRKRSRDYYHRNPNRKIRACLSRRLSAVLNNKVRRADRATALLGCSIKSFKIYIESQFQPGMGWENHGRGKEKWHLDHIIPCALFDLTKPEHQHRCFHFSNYQPLWEVDNFRKYCSLPAGLTAP